MSKQDNSNALDTLATSAENKEVKANPAGGFDAYYHGAKVAGPFTYSWEAMSHLHRLSYAPATPEAAPAEKVIIAFDDLTPEDAATAKMPAGMGYDSRCKWIAKRDYLIGRDGPITPAASTPKPAPATESDPAEFDFDLDYAHDQLNAARRVASKATPERKAEADRNVAEWESYITQHPDNQPAPINFAAMSNDELWDHMATPADQASPQAPAAPHAPTYKAGRDVLAEAGAALAIGAGDTDRIARLAGELCRAYASVKESRDLADKCTRKESRQQFYNDANQRSARAAALESELIEALAAANPANWPEYGIPDEIPATAPATIQAEIMAERLTFADQHSAGLAAAYARGFTDRVDGPDDDTPPARPRPMTAGQYFAPADEPAYTPDHNYYGRSDEPAWAPDDDEWPADDDSDWAAISAAREAGAPPEDEDPIYDDYDDPEDAERQRIELDRQPEYEAELYAQEYAAGVDEAHQHKRVHMPTLPAVEIAATAADLRNAMAALKKAAYRRDLAYASKAQTAAELADLESRLITQVCEEVNLTTGKPVFSNDTARKAEVKARLSTYPIARDAAEAEATHLAAKTEYDMAEQEVKTYRALLAHETQVLAMQTEIMAGQRQAQDADDLPF